jgi:hypothetical protein
VNADLSVKDGKITVKAAAAKKEEVKVEEPAVVAEEAEAVEETSAE